MEGAAPAVWVVLTTRTADPDPARFYRSREFVWRAVKARWPEAEYAALVEFTTGYGPKSGGARRPHWNLLVKGVPAEDAAALHDVVCSVWCRREAAEPWAQFVGAVSEVGGLMRYIALHFLKESQAPPAGWRGHRFSTSRGYLSKPTPQLRAEARRSLRLKRLLYKLAGEGLAGDELDLVARLELEAAEALTWTLIAVRRLDDAAVVEPLGEVGAGSWAAYGPDLWRVGDSLLDRRTGLLL